MSDFLSALRAGDVLLMDGAMGTELQRAGIGEHDFYELWNLKNPEAVRSIHREYVAAGARVLLTHTFQANLPALRTHNAEDRLEEINRAAVQNAAAAGGERCFILGDIGPVSECQLDSAGRFLASFHGVDALLLETCANTRLLSGILENNVEQLPVLISFSYSHKNGNLRTLSGMAPESCAQDALRPGVVALGVNCGVAITMEDIVDVVACYRKVTDLPVFARPNAGTPARFGDRFTYPQSAQKMAEGLLEVLDAGVAMVGGCCGTAPPYIAAFRSIVDDWNNRRRGTTGQAR